MIYNKQLSWFVINWKRCHQKLLIQQDILTEIVRNGETKKIESQQYKIMRSFSARALAVKRVKQRQPPMDNYSVPQVAKC